MRRDRMLRTGLVGTAVAGICCFTPALVILFGAVGLSAALAWADYVLLPMMAVFGGMAVYALVRRGRS